MTEILTRRRAIHGLGAFVLGLALLTGGCAGNGSGSTSSDDDPFDDYDDDSDGMLNQDEWNQFRIGLDTDGDGAVSHDEFDAGLGGGGGFRR